MDNFMTIKNATEFANVANYIKNNGTATDYCDECISYTHNGFEYTVWHDGIEEIFLDDTVITLYPDESLKYYQWR